MSTQASSSIFDPRIAAPAAVDSFRKLDPRRMARNPVMFVTELGAAFATILFLKDFGDATDEGQRLRRQHRRLAVVHRPLRELRRGDGGGSRQGPGRRAAQDARRDDRPQATRRRGDRGGAELAARRRRPGRRHGRRDHPRRRRRGRGHRERGRVGDHRRVRPGHPRVGRRPLCRHRRYARAVGRDRRPRHDPSRRELPRPHDRARRGCEPPEDAERDRARHPPRRAHDHPPPRDRDAAAVRRLLRRGAVGDRPHRAPRLPHPDHDRRAALRDRHRRHGPARAAQRARDERPRRRGRRRLLDAAARQDRDDHARQPAGERLHPRPGRHRATSSPMRPSSRASPTRRPRGARSSCSRRSATAFAAGSCTAPSSSRSRRRRA